MNDLSQQNPAQNPPMTEPVTPVQTPPVEQPQPLPPPTRSFLSKPLIILLIIIFLFAIFSAGTYFKFNQKLTNIINPPKPTPTPTASIPSPTPTIDPAVDWNTYTNTKHRFLFKYPQDFGIIPVPGDEVGLPYNYKFYQEGDEIIIFSKPSLDSNSFYHFGISLLTSIQCSNDEDCLRELQTNPNLPLVGTGTKPTGYITREILGKIMKGVEAKRIFYPFTETEQDFIVPKNGKIWLISTFSRTFSPEELASINKTFDQILSTFKFTNQNETTNWKTYINTKYGFSFKYPAEYKIGSCTNCLDLSSSDFITLSPPNMSSAKGYGSFMITHLKNKEQNQSISDYLNALSTIVNQPVVLGSEQQTSINGYAGLIVVNRDKYNDVDSKNAYLTNGIEGIQFSFHGYYTNENRGMHLDSFKNISVFDQILSTFKFLDQ